MKKENHEPKFRGIKPFSTTVFAYCPKCDAIIKDFKQPKCDACGWELDWKKVTRQ